MIEKRSINPVSIQIRTFNTVGELGLGVADQSSTNLPHLLGEFPINENGQMLEIEYRDEPPRVVVKHPLVRGEGVSINLPKLNGSASIELKSTIYPERNSSNQVTIVYPREMDPRN